MSQRAEVWLMFMPLLHHHAHIGGLKVTSKLAVMACIDERPETDVGAQ